MAKYGKVTKSDIETEINPSPNFLSGISPDNINNADETGSLYKCFLINLLSEVHYKYISQEQWTLQLITKKILPLM